MTASAAALLVLLSAAFAGVQASKAGRTSAWRDRVITIDGSDKDWAGLTTPVKNSQVSLGFVNDGDWLYLCLQAKHEGTRVQIASTGLIVWLAAQQARKDNFGIRFPSARSFPLVGREPEDRPGGWPDEIDVLGPGKDKSRTIPLDRAGGIQACAGIRPDRLVFELKVPLRPAADHPYAVGVEPGQVIRAIIETPEYRGPYARSSYIPGGWTGVTELSGLTTIGGSVVGGVPVPYLPVIPTPVSVQTTVLLATR